MSGTPQQAMKDAIDSGAVQAWIEGKDMQFSHIDSNDWIDSNGIEMPTFALKWVKWRVKPIPQKPTVADWRPISEIPKDGKRYLVRFNSGFIDFVISEPQSKFPTNCFGGEIITSFAPLPE